MAKGGRRSRTLDFCIGLSAAMSVVLVWSRLANLGTSFWGDEAYSAVYYADRGPHAIFFGKYVPNDHVLFNFLSWATTRWVGRFEAAYRFWSVVPGLVAVGVVAWWAWRRFGRLAGVAVVVLATISPVHLVLAPQARGYGLAMLCGAVMLVGAVHATDHSSSRGIAVFAAGALAGIWTIPVFALAAGTQALVLLARRDVRRRAVVAILVVAAASLAFYAPMLGDLVHNAGQHFGARLPWTGFLTGPYRDLAKPGLVYGLPLPVRSTLGAVAAFLVVAVLAIAAAVRLAGRSDRVTLAHLLVPPFGTYVLLVAGRFYVQPRFASYLLFHALVLLAIGTQQLWDVLSARPLRVLAALAIVVVSVTGTQRVGKLVAAQAATPWENEQFVGHFAKASGVQLVFTDSKHPAALQWYLGVKHVVVLHSVAVGKRSYCGVPGRFMFVDDRYGNQAVPDVRCLLQRRAIRIHVPQQRFPPIRAPGALTIYLVPGPAAGRVRPAR